MKAELTKKNHPNYEVTITCDNEKELDKWTQAATNEYIMEYLMKDSLFGQLGAVDSDTDQMLTIDFTKVTHKITGFSIGGNSITIKIRVLPEKEEDMIMDGLNSGLLSFKPRAIVSGDNSIFLITVDIVTNDK